jgi:hypothetical protein
VVEFGALIGIRAASDPSRAPVPLNKHYQAKPGMSPAGGLRLQVSANSSSAEIDAVDLPPFVRSELNEPISRGSWVWTIAPAYGGVFIWIPILDRLGISLANETSPGWLAATAVLAVLACYFLLYEVPATWGWSAGYRLGIVGASTFGTTGSEWISSVIVGLGAVVYYSVSVNMAIRLIMLGLLSSGLIDQSAFQTWRLGPLRLQSPVVLLTAGFWIYVITVVCRLRMASVIFTLMQVYTPVALLLLGATALLTSTGLPGFTAAKQSLAQLDPALYSHMEPGREHIFQTIFGCFAVSGLMGVEWGMAVGKRSDVHLGGWIGIILAGSFCTFMALLTVAGALGLSTPAVARAGGELPVVPLSFHWAVFAGIGGIKGGVILNLFGLATLAPGCYSAWAFRERLSKRFAAIRRRDWTRIGGFLAFVLIATSWAAQLELIFNLTGAIFASAVGALVADALRQKMRWHGVRRVYNPAGLLSWVIGLAIGLVPVFGALTDWDATRRFQPAALFAFLASAVMYTVLAAFGLERPLVRLHVEVSQDLPEPAPASSKLNPAAGAGG